MVKGRHLIEPRDFSVVELEELFTLAERIETDGMVAPKDKAVACVECHSADSRLKGIDGVYMPSYSNKGWLDIIGWLAAALTLIGVLIHGGLRIVMSGRK